MHGEELPTPVGPDRFSEGRRITWVSVIVNVVLTVMQVIVGLIAHSQALIADAMHTVSDIVSDFFVLYANRKGAEAPDDEHPYGHGRFETAASLVLGILLIVTGTGILISAIERLQNIGSAPPVGIAAIWAAVITLAGKEGLFRYMLAVAERLRSPMLVANAWHARADALSSLVVAVGIAGALLGFSFADAAAAIIVGAMIIKAGGEFALAAIRELIDTGLTAEEVAAIRTTLEGTPGVIDLHELRTRRMAHQALVDTHIHVEGRISVSEGHRIAETARARVLKAHPEVLDVLVHVDAEEDLDPALRGVGLPGRADIERHLCEMLNLEPTAIERTVLHYLGNSVEVELFLAPDSACRDDLDLAERLRQRLAEGRVEDQWLRAVTLHRRIAPN